MASKLIVDELESLDGTAVLSLAEVVDVSDQVLTNTAAIATNTSDIAAMPTYTEYAPIALGGVFTDGFATFTRIGNIVNCTIGGGSGVVHPTDTQVETGEIIPAELIPTGNFRVSNFLSSDEDTFVYPTVQIIGNIIFQYFDFAGLPVTQTGLPNPISFTYTLAVV